jgi:hypothetical protein
MEKKIWAQASVHMIGEESLSYQVRFSVSEKPSPRRYMRIPSSAFSRVSPLRTMKKMKMTGMGTVNQTT